MIKSDNAILSVMIILFIIMLGAFCRYWIKNDIIVFLYFLSLIALFYHSNKNYFWIALFFILASAPFGLFYGSDSIMIRITSKAGIRFSVFFVLIAIIKYIRSNYKFRNFFVPYLKITWAYSIVLIIIGVIYGLSTKSLYSLLNTFPNFLLFLVIPALFHTKKEFDSFNKIILLFSLVLVVESIADIVLFGNITKFLAPSGLYLRYDPGIHSKSELIRLTAGMFICFYSLIMSLYYLSTGTKEFKQAYLMTVVFFSSLFIINSATRGWIVACIFSVFSTFVIYHHKYFKYSLIFIVILLMSISLLPERIKVNLKLSYERFITLEALAEGDLSADKTLARLTERGPRVLKQFSNNEITGFGYSEITDKFYDEHVGNHSLLLVGGLVGFIIVYFTIIRICFWIFNIRRALADFPAAVGLTVIILGFISVFIIHSSSRDMFSYYMPFHSAFLMSLFLTLPDIIIRQKLVNQLSIQSSDRNNILSKTFILQK